MTATKGAPLEYQWYLDGTAIDGARSASYGATVRGTYHAVVRDSSGTVTSHPIPVDVVLPNRFANISTRAQIGSGGNVCIAGFVISTSGLRTKRVLIRAVGPGLTQFGLTGVLAQPVLTLFDATGRTIAENNGWNNSPAIAAASAAVGAFPLPAGSADAALILDLAPGSYTAQVSGANSTTGIGLVEVYEVTADTGIFVNISTRASVETAGGTLIGGFVVSGRQGMQVLIRGIGPALSSFGVGGFLSQPVLSIYNSRGDLIGVNVGWSNGGSAAAIATANAASAVNAFPLQPGSADCAIVTTSGPGAYTVQVTGVNGTTGTALLEVYQIP